MTAHPDISIVIPVLNGEPFIAENLDRLSDALRSTRFSYEIIVVDDGSTDRTREIVQTRANRGVRLCAHQQNKGKHAALVTGMKSASGACRVFTDADLPFDLASLPYLHALVVERKIHIAVGDRTLPESTYRQQLGMPRRLATRGFSFLIRLLITGGLFDTQCGLKAFRGDVADGLFPVMTERGFAGDVELLYVALKYNLEIKRIPVLFDATNASTVSLLRHALPMLLRSLRFPRNWKKGVYRSEKLEALARQNYWGTTRVALPPLKAA